MNQCYKLNSWWQEASMNQCYKLNSWWREASMNQCYKLDSWWQEASMNQCYKNLIHGDRRLQWANVINLIHGDERLQWTNIINLIHGDGRLQWTNIINIIKLLVTVKPRAHLKQIALNWALCWSYLLLAVLVHITTVQVLQRTTLGPTSLKTGPGQIMSCATFQWRRQY